MSVYTRNRLTDWHLFTATQKAAGTRVHADDAVRPIGLVFFCAWLLLVATFFSLREVLGSVRGRVRAKHLLLVAIFLSLSEVLGSVRGGISADHAVVVARFHLHVLGGQESPCVGRAPVRRVAGQAH